MSYWYMATPYARYPHGMEAAYKLACEQAAVLIRGGIGVYAPIAHSHGVALHGGIESTEHEYWMAIDRPMIDAARGLIMLRAESWQESRGMAYELETFKRADKPVIWMDPGIIPVSLYSVNRQVGYAAERLCVTYANRRAGES